MKDLAYPNEIFSYGKVMEAQEKVMEASGKVMEADGSIREVIFQKSI